MFARDVEAMELTQESVEQYLTHLRDRSRSSNPSGFDLLNGVLSRLDSCKKCCLLTDSHVVLAHQLRVLEKEFYALPRGTVPLDESLLSRLVELEHEYASGVRASKQKDVIRAESIIPEYSETVREYVAPGSAWEPKLSKEHVTKVLSLDGTIVNAEQRAKHIEVTVREIINAYLKA